jgi:hypothetical protein
MESFKVHKKVGIGEWKLQLGEIANVCLIVKNWGFSQPAIACHIQENC